MGVFWSFLTPVLMLAVYTFVFSVVFKARWSSGSDSKTEFALVLFAGLLFFNIFTECFNRSSFLIVSNVNYVKKVIFPLEILPFVALCTAVFNFLIGFSAWLVFYGIFFGLPSLNIFLFPLVMLPLMFLTLGVSWFLAALGVFLRDVGQIVAMISTVLTFLSPIFFPVSALPEKYRIIMQINPLTFIIEQAREVMIFGGTIDWSVFFMWLLSSMFLAWAGFSWFQKTRKGFADVL